MAASVKKITDRLAMKNQKWAEKVNSRRNSDVGGGRSRLNSDVGGGRSRLNSDIGFLTQRATFERQNAQTKMGKYTHECAPGYREACMTALQMAE